MFFIIMHFWSQKHLPRQCIHKSSFLEQIMGNGP